MTPMLTVFGLILLARPAGIEPAAPRLGAERYHAQTEQTQQIGAVPEPTTSGIRLNGRPLASAELPLLLVIPEPAPQTPRAGIGPWPYVALVAGNTADYVTTYRFQGLGNYEGNPLWGQNRAALAAAKAGGTAFLVWLTHRFDKAGHPTIAKVFAYSAGAVTAGVAIKNERFYRDRARWNRAVAEGTAVCVPGGGCRY